MRADIASLHPLARPVLCGLGIVFLFIGLAKFDLFAGRQPRGTKPAAAAEAPKPAEASAATDPAPAAKAAGKDQ